MNSHFGQWLRAKRQERGLSAYRLAIQSGLSRNYISLIENGKRLPADEVLQQLAEALDVRFETLKLATFADRVPEEEQRLLAQWLVQEGKIPIDGDDLLHELVQTYRQLSNAQKREALQAWQSTLDRLLDDHPGESHPT